MNIPLSMLETAVLRKKIGVREERSEEITTYGIYREENVPQLCSDLFKNICSHFSLKEEDSPLTALLMWSL